MLFLGKYNLFLIFSLQVEGETAEKIALANFKIVDLRSRLVHTAAEIEHIVEIERTTFRALHLKTMIRKW